MNNIQTKPEDLPFAVTSGGKTSTLTDQQETTTGFRSNDTCPHCHSGKMEYNGMLNLECSICGYTLGGCFT
jgi:uncharacterized protein (DUF983 family)